MKRRRDGATGRRKGPGAPRSGGSPLGRHALYELCVQSPADIVGLLRAVHGGEPRVLGEDFCGTAAVSREWVARVPGGRAIAIDRDPAVLRVAGGLAGGGARRPRLVRADVLNRSRRPGADVIFVGNFSIGEIHERNGLVRYLEASRARLRPGGVFVCDTYGGESAFRIGGVERIRPGPDGARIRYTWEQRRADPLTGMVENAMHFRVEVAGEVVQEVADAFVYRWRLWSVPELRDAMAEAGFAGAEVYDQLPDGVDQHGRVYVRPVGDPRDLGESFIVCVAGRRSAAPRKKAAGPRVSGGPRSR